jgi:hypothetical protein
MKKNKNLNFLVAIMAKIQVIPDNVSSIFIYKKFETDYTLSAFKKKLKAYEQTLYLWARRLT